MNKTLNADAISQVKLTPIKESGIWKILPPTEYRPSFFDDVFGYLFGKVIKLPERVGSEYSWSTYSLEEFEEYNSGLFIKDGKIYEKCVVRVDFISNNGTEKYFKDTSEAVKLYDELIVAIENKVSYTE